MSRTRLQLAQWIAEKGLTIFPLRPDSKQPYENYPVYTRRTTDPKVVAQMFAEFEDCNYAVNAGPEHGIIDLDIKVDANGVKLFDEICAENGIIDFLLELNTFTVKTPGGGYHLYFKMPFKIRSANNFPNGIDVRGGIGYVVGPGSYWSHSPNGNNPVYEIVNDSDIIDCPEFLLEYLRQPHDRDPNAEVPVTEWDQPDNIEQALEFLATRDPALQGHTGDEWTFKTCCFLRDFGISESEAFRLLNVSGWNERCTPSWDADELLKKIENSYEYGENRPGCKSRTYKVERLVAMRPNGGYPNLTPQQLQALFHPKSPLELVVDNTKPKVIEEDSEIPTDVADDDDVLGGSDEEERQYWYGVNEFAELPSTREYIISDWLVAHGMTAIVAKRGTGKSTVALDMACHIAKDMDWWGTSTLKDWCAIYLCGEDAESMILNTRVWGKYHNGLPSSDRFMVGHGIIYLDNQTELTTRLEEMKAWANGRRCVIFLDTWTRATGTLKESDDVDMKLAVKNAELLARGLDGPMVTCAHPPKNSKELTIRGSAIGEDNSSGLLFIEKCAEGIKVINNRIKGGGEGVYRIFKIEIIETDEMDQHGKLKTGVIPVKIGGTEEDKTPERIAERQSIVDAWAWAVRGCLVFPMENGSVQPLEKDIPKYVTIMIGTMWENRGRDDDAQAFSVEYLEPIVKLVPKTTFSSDPSGTTAKRLREFLSGNRDYTPVRFEDDTELWVPSEVQGSTSTYKLMPTKEKGV